MDILRNLFGNLTSGIIRLAVTVGILAAAYFFLLKPVLDTTEKVSDNFRQGLPGDVGGVSGEIERAMTQVNEAIERSTSSNVTPTEAHQMKRQVRHSFKVVKKDGNPKRLIKCIQRARGDVGKIQRCTVKF